MKNKKTFSELKEKHGLLPLIFAILLSIIFLGALHFLLFPSLISMLTVLTFTEALGIWIVVVFTYNLFKTYKIF